MKKYKMIALTGILLSSTILGANTSLVQAASTSSTKGSEAAPLTVTSDDVITKPSAVFSNGTTSETMNFKDGEKFSKDTVENTSDFTPTSMTGSKEKVTYAISNVADDITTKGGKVSFIPEQVDSNGKLITGNPLTRSVVIYTEPTAAFNSRKVEINDGESLNQPQIVNGSNGQRFSVSISNPDLVDVTKAGTTGDVSNAAKTDKNVITYVATAINPDGSKVIDKATNQPLRYTEDGTVTVTDDANVIPYNILIKDKKTGNVIATQSGETTNGSESVPLTATLPTGYSFTKNQAVTISKSKPTQTVSLSKSVDYNLSFEDKDTEQPIANANQTGTATEGSPILVTAPEGYTLTNPLDTIYTADSNDAKKTISVTKKAVSTQNLNYTIEYRELSTGNLVDETTGQANFGDWVGTSAPAGYSFAALRDRGFFLLNDGKTFTSYVNKKDTTFNISYVDEATDKEVGTQSGKNVDGTTVVLSSPKGYSFVNADDVNYTVNKDEPNATIYVKKSDDSNVEANDIVATYPGKGNYVKIYDADGNLNDDVVLSSGSSWIIDQTREINGVEYYRVATNEYIKASDAYKYTPLQSVVTTKSGDVKPVYNSKGQLVIDLALDKSTPWYTDRSATIKGEKMYRVATDEWVRATDVDA